MAIDNLQLWSDTALVRKASANVVTASEQEAINAKREQTFNMYWNSHEGVKRIAFAMSGPLKTRLDYVGIGRKLLMVDTIPAGEIPFYDLDMPEFGAVKIAARGQAPVFEQAIKRITVPTFEVTVNEVIKKMELSVRRYDVFNRAKERAAISMAIAEDDLVFELVKTAADKNTIGTYGTNGNNDFAKKADFAEMYGKISERQLITKTYLMGPRVQADILKWNADELDQVSLNIQLETGNFGSVFGVRTVVATRLDQALAKVDPTLKGTKPIFALTSPDKLGRMPERKAVEVSIFDNIPKLEFSIVGYEIIGMAIYNIAGVEGIKHA
jgi:hypothetical protein